MQATMRQLSCRQARRAAWACSQRPHANRPVRSSQQWRSSTSTNAAAGAASTSQPSWDIRMLYDGDCPLCMKEVNFLRSRDAGKGKIDFMDIASPSYTAEDNYGITYEQAMERIHAILSDGTIVTDVEVFRHLYDAVGLGWVYAATKYEPVLNAANAVYAVWAKYRTQLTGREAMEVIMQRRKALAAGQGVAGSLCKDESAECALPVTAGTNQQQKL